MVPGDESGFSVGTVSISRGWRRYVRLWSLATRYLPVEGVDWEAIRDSADDVSVGLGVEGGTSGGRREVDGGERGEVEGRGGGRVLLLAGGSGAEVWRCRIDADRATAISFVVR